jgi:vacuolar-type H+-ATPase subunit H
LSSPVETTIKALIEFESELDRTKTEVLEVKKVMIKDAQDFAESAKSSVVLRAQQQALEMLTKARAEAEGEAASIRKKGESALKSFEESISRKKARAVTEVVGRLLGETR